MAGVSNPNLPTYELNATSVVARAAEYPGGAAIFAGGVNEGGSCAPGIGINTSFIDPKLEDWSVEDQHEDARDPQLGQHLGGLGLGNGVESPVPTDVTSAFPLQAAQGADLNDTLTFIVALAQAAPGVGFGAGNADPINRTDVTIEIGDRAWGTNTVA